MKSTIIRLDESDYARAVKLAKVEGLTFTAFVRQALKEHMRRQAKQYAEDKRWAARAKEAEAVGGYLGPDESEKFLRDIRKEQQ